MGLRKLRVYNGPENDAAGVSLLEQQIDPHSIKVTLGEILPILADAVSSDRTWLTDFAEDEVTISLIFTMSFRPTVTFVVRVLKYPRGQ